MLPSAHLCAFLHIRLLLCFWGSFGVVQELEPLFSNIRCCGGQDWTRSEEDAPSPWENTISGSKKHGWGREVPAPQASDGAALEEVPHSDGVKAIRKFSDWLEVWQVIAPAVTNQHMLTCSFVPQTAQAAAWADRSHGALHAAWLPLAQRQLKNPNPSASWCYKTTCVSYPCLGKKLIPGPGTFCGREVRDLGGAAISYIRATSDLPLHPTGEKGLATSNCLPKYFECRQKSWWKSYIQFKTTLAVHQYLCLPYKLPHPSFKIY